MLKALLCAALAAGILWGSGAQTAESDPCKLDQTDPTIDNTFECLFNIFPRSGGTNTIGAALAEQAASEGGFPPIKPGGPLIIVNGWGVFVYTPQSDGTGKLVDFVLTRDQANTGFTQMTALSHVGPAVAYLAALAEGKSDKYKSLRDDLLARVKLAAKTLEANQDWIQKTAAYPAWKTYKKKINRMMAYGLWMSADYLTQVKNEKVTLNEKNVGTDFYNGQLKRKDGKNRYPIPFNNIMIATFMLTDLQSVSVIRDMIARNGSLDFANAQVLVHMQIGTNLGAGLTARTNQLTYALKQLSGGAIKDVNILIAPFARGNCPVDPKKPYQDCDVSYYQAALSAEDFKYFSQTVWLGIYNRTRIAQNAFQGIPLIDQPDPPPIPGDYDFDKSGAIDPLMQRLQNSLILDTELLSNAVGFWMPGEFAAKGFDPSKVNIPGLTSGFPNGVPGYPGNLPAVE